MLLDDIHNYSVVLILLQSTHDDRSHNSLNTLDTDGNRATVDRVVAFLLVANGKLGAEQSLIAIKLAVHVPAAVSESENCVPLSAHPALVVGNHAGASHSLEDDL